MLTSHPGNMVRRITEHYGTPVLYNVPALPEENTHDSARKLVTVLCDTRELLRDLYMPLNELLYAQIDLARLRGEVPTNEPPFTRFSVRVPCGEREEAMGDLDARRLEQHFLAVGRRGQAPGVFRGVGGEQPVRDAA